MSLWTQALVQHIIEYNTIFILYLMFTIQFEKRRGFRPTMLATCPLVSVRSLGCLLQILLNWMMY